MLVVKFTTWTLTDVCISQDVGIVWIFTAIIQLGLCDMGTDLAQGEFHAGMARRLCRAVQGGLGEWDLHKHKALGFLLREVPAHLDTVGVYFWSLNSMPACVVHLVVTPVLH